MKYIICKVDDVNEKELAFLYSFLPKSRKNKVDKIKIQKNKEISIISYFMVKKLLNLKKILDFSYTKNGKPYIKNKPYFNISHSKNIIVVACDEKPIGVDIQEIIPYSEKLANYICNKKELKQIKTSKNKNNELTKLWVKKESYIKLKGKTICCDLKKVLNKNSIYNFKIKKYENNYICFCQKKSNFVS